jgi:hypothetical protein
MAKHSKTMDDEPLGDIVINPPYGQEEILQALLRLRQLGEKLPPVDAAMVIREGRDMANASNDQ